MRSLSFALVLVALALPACATPNPVPTPALDHDAPGPAPTPTPALTPGAPVWQDLVLTLKPDRGLLLPKDEPVYVHFALPTATATSRIGRIELALTTKTPLGVGPRALKLALVTAGGDSASGPVTDLPDLIVADDSLPRPGATGVTTAKIDVDAAHASDFWLRVTSTTDDLAILSESRSDGPRLGLGRGSDFALLGSVPLASVSWMPIADAPRPRRAFAGLSGGEFWGFYSDKNDDWSYGNDSGEPSNLQLEADGRGQGFFRVDLPPTATGAVLRALKVAYTADDGQPASGVGRVRWSLVADAGGKPSDTVLASFEVDVTPWMLTPLGGAGFWVTHPVGAELPAVSWLRFETVSGSPRVAANRYPDLAADGASRLLFRKSPTDALTPVGARAYLKLIVDNVGR